MTLNFNWLNTTAGFALSEYSLPYTPNDSYAWAILVAWINSLKVILASLFLSTLFGVLAISARLSGNSLLKFLSNFYVAFVRQTPLLLQLLFWYFVAFLSLPESSILPPNLFVQLTNNGIHTLGIKLSAEFSALLIGLSIFTGASIAEVLRGGINSVSRGQWEAYRSLGIKEIQGLCKVIFPQALPAIIPGLTSQYLNLAKNSTLAIAIGYADIYAVSDTTITQTGRAIEGFIILLLSFLLLNLIISNAMNIVNRIVSDKKYKL